MEYQYLIMYIIVLVTLTIPILMFKIDTKNIINGIYVNKIQKRLELSLWVVNSTDYNDKLSKIIAIIDDSVDYAFIDHKELVTLTVSALQSV